jgi:sarcosine oxidase
MKSYDVAVIGLGTMGAFACCDLARRGLSVIGLDRYSAPHDRGSHSGETRVFRIAYAEHSDYVPLAQRASVLWDEYSQLAGVQLLNRCGMISIGPADSTLIRGILSSATTYGLRVVRYSTVEIRRQFPAIAPGDAEMGVFEPTAGWVDVDAAIRSALQLARQAGAVMQKDTPVLNWTDRGTHIEVTTGNGSIAAEKVVVTAGAWAGQILNGIGLPLRVERKVLTWIDPLRPELFAPGTFPVFAFAENFLYGFPNIGEQGVKLAIHWERGSEVADPTKPVPPAESEEARQVLKIAARSLPSLAGPLPEALQRVRRLKTCLYTMTPDQHFLIDRHPSSPNLIFAAGFSGHGFKFAPAVGEALADLVTLGETRLPMQLFRIGNRFG